MNETFARWCLLRDCQPLPAAPADIARFVDEAAPIGIDRLWPIVQEIARDHYTKGLADPTAGGLVATAINRIAMIEPPRSWLKEEKLRFLRLPYDLQLCVSERERQREQEVRRAQNEAADIRKQFGITKVKDGIHIEDAAA